MTEKASPTKQILGSTSSCRSKACVHAMRKAHGRAADRRFRIPRAQASHFRGLATRAKHLESDRPDVLLAAKESCRYLPPKKFAVGGRISHGWSTSIEKNTQITIGAIRMSFPLELARCLHRRRPQRHELGRTPPKDVRSLQDKELRIAKHSIVFRRA